MKPEALKKQTGFFKSNKSRYATPFDLFIYSTNFINLIDWLINQINSLYCMTDRLVNEFVWLIDIVLLVQVPYVPVPRGEDQVWWLRRIDKIWRFHGYQVNPSTLEFVLLISCTLYFLSFSWFYNNKNRFLLFYSRQILFYVIFKSF